MLRTIALLAVIAALSACKKDENKPSEEPTPAEESSAGETAPEGDETGTEAAAPEAEAEAVIAIVPGSVHIAPPAGGEGEATTIELAESGQISMGGTPQGMLTPDGEIHDQDGKLLASITADGTVTALGKDESVTIAEDGSIVRGGEVLASIGDDGMLGGAMSEQVQETIHFEVKPEGRRALAYVFLVATMVGEESQPAEP